MKIKPDSIIKDLARTPDKAPDNSPDVWRKLAQMVGADHISVDGLLESDLLNLASHFETSSDPDLVDSSIELRGLVKCLAMLQISCSENWFYGLSASMIPAVSGTVLHGEKILKRNSYTDEEITNFRSFLKDAMYKEMVLSHLPTEQTRTLCGWLNLKSPAAKAFESGFHKILTSRAQERLSGAAEQEPLLAAVRRELFDTDIVPAVRRSDVENGIHNIFLRTPSDRIKENQKLSIVSKISKLNAEDRYDPDMLEEVFALLPPQSLDFEANFMHEGRLVNFKIHPFFDHANGKVSITAEECHGKFTVNMSLSQIAAGLEDYGDDRTYLARSQSLVESRDKVTTPGAVDPNYGTIGKSWERGDVNFIGWQIWPEDKEPIINAIKDSLEESIRPLAKKLRLAAKPR